MDRKGGRARSMSLETMAPLGGVSGVHFISLQHGPQAAELLAQPKGLHIRSVMPESSSIADASALICNVDLVVTVDTLAAHLAGSLGKPVWTLLRYAADWRWGIAGERTAWYQTMRLFRQTRAGDWSGVIEKVRDALAAM